MTYQKKKINVIRGVFPTILMHYPATPGQAHGRKPIILGDNQIAPAHPVDQCVVDTVCTFVKYQGIGALPVKFMGGITQKGTGNLIFFAQPDGNVYDGTAVGIDENIDRNHPFAILYHRSNGLQNIFGWKLQGRGNSFEIEIKPGKLLDFSYSHCYNNSSLEMYPSG